MTAFDYSRAVATAERMLARYGQVGALRVPAVQSGGKPYDPAPDPAPVDHPARFVVLEYEEGEADGAAILYTDKKVYLAAAGLGAEPKAGHHLVENDGKTLRVISVAPLKPGGTVVMYTVQARRGQ